MKKETKRILAEVALDLLVSTYNNKILFFLVFLCERLYSFGAKEELENLKTKYNYILQYYYHLHNNL